MDIASGRENGTRHQIFPGTGTVSHCGVACKKGCGISFPGAFLLKGRGMEEMTLEGPRALAIPANSSQLAEQPAGEAAVDGLPWVHLSLRWSGPRKVSEVATTR